MMKLHSSLFFFTLASVVIVLCSCSEEPTPPPPQPVTNITLALGYTDFEEVEIKISITNAQSPHRLRLTKNGAVVLQTVLFSIDTMIVDRALSPGTNYEYCAFRIVGRTESDTSNFISTRTRDYSTHNWRFEIDTLGEHLSGVKEVIAFSSTNAWVT